MIFLRSALFAVALLVVTPPFAIFSVLTFPLAPMSRYRIISRWSRIMLFAGRHLCGLHYRVEGGEHLPALSEKLAAILRAETPARIYLPHPEDNHPDHRAAFPAACRALHASGASSEIFAYEVWTPLARAEEIEDITTVFRTKLRAIRCHRSQLSTFRYDRAARGLAAYRGALHAKCRFAEAFEPLLPETD